MIDVVDPHVQFTAGDFVRNCRTAGAADPRTWRDFAGCRWRGVLPVATFLHGLSAAPPADPELRRELQQRARQEGTAALHRELVLHDPATGDPPSHRRHTNRIVRALEVHRAYRAATVVVPQSRVLYAATTGCSPSGCSASRVELYARIDRRVEQMFAVGLDAEVAALRACGYHADTPGMRTIGYAEFFREVSSRGTP